MFSAPALYPIAIPKRSELADSPMLTLPLAVEFFPIATPVDVTAGSPATP